MSGGIEILLFYSNFSKYCKTPIQICKEYNLPVSMICIDNSLVRKTIKYGDRFTVRVVPTLLCNHNNTIKIYEGSKVNMFLQEYIETLYSEDIDDDHEQLINTEDDYIQPFIEQIPEQTQLNHSIPQKEQSSIMQAAKEMQREREELFENTSHPLFN